jgi:hypothetical protein
VEGIRDRVYASLRHRQEKEARRIQEGEARKRAAQRDDDRKHTERTRKKVVFLEEARRRAVTLLKTRAMSFLERLQLLEDILTQLDSTLSGDESLSEAYASIEAVLQARVTGWNADDAENAARQQEEWGDIGTAVVVILSVWFMYAKGPDILQWLWKILSPEPGANSERAQQPATEAPPHASDESLTPRRPRTSPATEHSSPPPYPD